MPRVFCYNLNEIIYSYNDIAFMVRKMPFLISDDETKVLFNVDFYRYVKQSIKTKIASNYVCGI